ncbi:hypothetical protein J3459_009709 [Metarhizium acridum]|nr:hypothetical protein J3459_009709 [Metarhizium acridum]
MAWNPASCDPPHHLLRPRRPPVSSPPPSSSPPTRIDGSFFALLHNLILLSFYADSATSGTEPTIDSGEDDHLHPSVHPSNQPASHRCLVSGKFAILQLMPLPPAILVTPLGALSVLIGAVLGSYFLKEELGTLGKLGSAICLIGAVVIVLHAPPDEEIETIDQILDYALRPGFLLYAITVVAFAVFMIYRIAPQYGKKNALIYLSICSTVGSISVMSVKAFGIALKLTFAGNNQFSHPSTYVFLILTAVCILTQMNYFNKALASFPTNIVNPLYYVTFTTATLCASFILFSGFNTTDPVNTLSLLCGFLVTFTGVYLLNLSRGDPNACKPGAAEDPSRHSMGSLHSDREGLIRAYDEEEAAGFGLTDLAEESEDEGSRSNGKANGKKEPCENGIELQNQKSTER